MKILHPYKYKTAISILGLANQPVQEKINELLNISYPYNNLKLALKSMVKQTPKKRGTK